MAEFLVEVYFGPHQLQAVDGWLSAASAAAADLSRDADPVRCVRSIVVPEDETCFLVYEAASIDAVRAAVLRAGLEAGRIRETLGPVEGPTDVGVATAERRIEPRRLGGHGGVR
jgi:Protein of unknown function (DUF4242)